MEMTDTLVLDVEASTPAEAADNEAKNESLPTSQSATEMPQEGLSNSQLLADSFIQGIGPTLPAVSKRSTNSRSTGRQIITRRADQITPRKLRWLWPDRIPMGKVTIFAGMPGEGKSLATVDIAARVTTSRKYPYCDNPLPAGEVLFIAGEDDPEDALVPRLTAAGADLPKVHVQTEVCANGQGSDSLRLDRDVEGINDILNENPNIRLIIIDPISNHLGSVSMIDEQEVRRILAPLSRIAAVQDVAIIGVMHLNKKEGLSAIHRVGGAGAFIGLARASWLFARDQEMPSERFMLPLKNNYSRGCSSLGYRMDEMPVKIGSESVPIPYIVWLRESNLDVDEIVSTPPKRTSRTEAQTFLKKFLVKGPQEASEVTAAAAAEGISDRTLDRAKSDLGIESRKKGTGWEWALPDEQPKDASTDDEETGGLGVLQNATTA
jgi:putative DNA primase/helicase